jgi:diguanylate cyclase (GGDEF)-like protein
LEEIKHKQSKLAQLSVTDFLTKLYNSLYFDSKIKSYQANGENFWIIYVKINNFKRINQLYGYYGANKILRTFSKILTEATASKAVIAKLHGASFGALLKDCDKNYVREIGKRLYSEFFQNSELNNISNYSALNYNVSSETPIAIIYKKLQTNIELIETGASENNLFIQ